MKLSEIIKKSTWQDVEMLFSKLYPDQMEYVDAYQKLFQSFPKLEAEESTIEIVLQYTRENETGTLSVIEVYGIDRKTPLDSIALEYVQWEKWLGMTIHQLTIIEFTVPEIITHCLCEMTWAGFEQKEIQTKFTKINKMRKK